MAHTRIAYFTVNSGAYAESWSLADSESQRFGIHTLRGSEAISQLFSFELRLLTKDDVDIQELVGHSVTLRLRIDDADGFRPINGIVSRCTRAWNAGQKAEAEGYALFLATVVPSIWTSSKRFQSRVFQEMTVPEIVDAAFTDPAAPVLPGTIDPKLASTYRKREHCNQYRESDLDFASRLMEQEGIAYYFTHSVDGLGHGLVISDGLQFDADGTIPIRSLFEQHQIQSNRYQVEVDNFRASMEEKVAEPPDDQLDRTIYDYPGGFGAEDHPFPAQGELRTHVEELAKKRLEEQEARVSEWTGTSERPDLKAGWTFTAELGGEDVPLLLTHVRHTLRQAPPYTSAGAPPNYRNSITCTTSPAATPSFRYRPPRRTRRPRVEGPQTAVVVSHTPTRTDGPDPELSKYGRVAIRFRWDDEKKSGSDGIQTHKTRDHSCWVRVSEPWAGAHPRGVTSTPRIGEEVIVSFLEGDPDRPVITGRLYNSQKPAYATETTTDDAGDTTETALIDRWKTIFDDGGGNKLIMNAQEGGHQSLKLISTPVPASGEGDAGAAAIVLTPDGGVHIKSTEESTDDWSGTRAEIGFGHKYEVVGPHFAEAHLGLIQALKLGMATDVLIGPSIGIQVGPKMNYHLGYKADRSGFSVASHAMRNNILTAANKVNIVGGYGGWGKLFKKQKRYPTSILNADGDTMTLSIGENVQPKADILGPILEVTTGVFALLLTVLQSSLGGVSATVWKDSDIGKFSSGIGESILDGLLALLFTTAGIALGITPEKVVSHEDVISDKDVVDGEIQQGDNPNAVIHLTNDGKVEVVGEDTVIIGTPKETRKDQRVLAENKRAQIKLGGGKEKLRDIEINRHGDEAKEGKAESKAARIKLDDAGILIASAEKVTLKGAKGVEIGEAGKEVRIKGKKIDVGGGTVTVLAE